MKQIRRGTFETNSSSTHSITICPKETYDKWLNGEMLFDEWNDKFIDSVDITPDDYLKASFVYENSKGKYYKGWIELTKEEQKEYTTEYVLKNLKQRDSYKYLTYDEWRGHQECLETYTKYYTSPSGDELVAFGAYGYDG